MTIERVSSSLARVSAICLATVPLCLGCATTKPPPPLPRDATTLADQAAMLDPEERLLPGFEAGSTQPCADSLEPNECPPEGCATSPQQSDLALLNETKRHLPSTAGTPKQLTFQRLNSLQQKAEQKLGAASGQLDAEARQELKHLSVSGVSFGEGDYVELSGYLTGGPNRPGPSGKESVNCRRPSPDVDFHIPVAPAAHDLEFHSVVVEMIPQGRPDAWTVAKLQFLRDQGTLVRFRGQLLYDNMHQPNGDPANPIQGQPKRFSLWEIHPVTSCEVCRNGATCDQALDADWILLEDFTPPADP